MDHGWKEKLRFFKRILTVFTLIGYIYLDYRLKLKVAPQGQEIGEMKTNKRTKYRIYVESSQKNSDVNL